MKRTRLAPLQTLNLFEVAYWFLLAYGVADATDFSFKRSFGLVMSSYGVGLVFVGGAGHVSHYNLFLSV